MKCAEFENLLALNADGASPEADGSLSLHLDGCPLCRQKKDDYAEIRLQLRRLVAPKYPTAARNELRNALRAEIGREILPKTRLSGYFTAWLQMRLVPYSIGVAVSVVVGFGLLTTMFNGHLQRSDIPAARSGDGPPVILASNRRSSGDGFSLTAADVVSSRMQFAQVSPSVNPEGALIALTKSLVRGEMKDEEVVVVADVFSNGLATISEVVESPKDKRIVEDLEKALANDPNYAPFVPTVIEHRPEYMQIVLKIQNVNVPTGLKPLRRRS